VFYCITICVSVKYQNAYYGNVRELAPVKRASALIGFGKYFAATETVGGISGWLIGGTRLMQKDFSDNFVAIGAVNKTVLEGGGGSSGGVVVREREGVSSTGLGLGLGLGAGRGRVMIISG
jgi:hypothetical protein